MIFRLLRFVFFPFLPLVFFITKQLEKKDIQGLAKATLISVQSFYSNKYSPNYALGRFLLNHHCPEQALKYLKLANSMRPNALAIKYYLASAFWDSGEIESALALTESLIAVKLVKHPVLLRCQAKLFVQKGAYNKAKDALKISIEADKNYATAFYDLGQVSNQFFQQPEQAKEYFIEALTIDRQFIKAHIELAKLMFKTKLYAEAISHYVEAIKKNRADFDLFVGLIRSCIRNKQFDDGLVYCDQASEFFSQQPELFFFYGECYRGINDLQQSIVALNNAISLVPDYAEAYASLAYTYRNAGQFNQALQYINEAIGKGSGKPGYFNVKGLIYVDLMTLDDALASFNHAIELKSDFYTAVWHRAIVKLLMFDFKTGWQDYSFRFQSGAQEMREFSFQKWQGESLKGKKLLIYAEQGLGDEMMFASCLADIIDQPDHCIIDCSVKLENIFQRSFPTTMVKVSDQNELCDWINDIEADYQVSIADLPLYYRTSWEHYPRKPYLIASEDKTLYWQNKLDALDGKLNVGISWIGGAHQTNRHWRSFALQTLLPILVQKEINFISLQYTDCLDEIMNVEANNGIKVHYWQQAIDDYDETAALVNALDLVVSVQTAIIHLAGALGKPAWVMVRNNPEWRYGAKGEEMPWYGSVKLFRQQKFGDWEAVVERISDALKKLVKKEV